MPTTSSQQKETKMSNVETLKATPQSTQTALVVIDQMTPKEALMTHTAIKNQGRGAVIAFIKNETPYNSYPKYYYELTKKGVAPFKAQGPKKKAATQNNLQLRIEQLEMQLAVSLVSPAKRAMSLLQDSRDQIGGKSRRFLCDVVCYDRSSLTVKQEKWMTDLEETYS